MTEGADSWSSPVPVPELTTAQLARAGVVFRHGDYLYRSTGQVAGSGGMGHAFLLQVRPIERTAQVRDHGAVAKVFHGDYLRQVKTDPVIHRDYECALRSLTSIAGLSHPNILPVFLAEPIADNHLTVTPLMAGTLRQIVTPGLLSQRKRVGLLISALRGLAALHDAGFIHRDFTLHNVLVDAAVERCAVFDFDLAMAERDFVGHTYRGLYQGRLFGSPGYSVAPEELCPVLMDSEISQLVDVYAVGGAIFALFTDELPYGRTEDMWSLLLRVTDGVVLDGRSRIVYPDAVPLALRPIIELCLERNPDRRYPGIEPVIEALERTLPHLADRDLDEVPVVYRTMRFGDPDARVNAVFDARVDASVSRREVQAVSKALDGLGYELRRAMGRVKGHPIFMASPRADLVAAGRFPDSNMYPKLVTAISIADEIDREHVIDLWIGGYLPILRAARQGLMTPLYRVVHDDEGSYLLLFSEYVDDVRFGTDLDALDLSLGEVLALGYVVARQVRRLHLRGMAHNNVTSGSLLLKAIRASRRVHPAMVGIVAPSFDAGDMASDVRHLAGLVLSWLRTDRILDGEAVHRERLADVHQRLAAVADGVEGLSIEQFTDLCADGLSVIDFNFGVLRESKGDLDEYALLVFSPTLYGRLWTVDR